MLILGGGIFSTAYAHTTVEVEPYFIEVGWGIEPPVVGIRNDFVFEISESPSEGVKAGVKNAFKNLEAAVKFGGVTKKLDINADPKAGHYYSPVIPTKTGSMSVLFQGEIEGIAVDVDIPIEDVESTAVLDFPPRTTSGPESNAPLKAAISQLQKEVSELKTGGSSISSADVGPAYDFAIFGLSLGAAGVILAIIAMIKRK
ncbi:MAG: hypothetical protein ACE5RJ_00330 [Nitrosopumilaceae archaeon]